MKLAPDQLKIAQMTDPRLLVIAGPGSGKTATLAESVTHRISEGVADPEKVTVVTFTRRAAFELRDRLQIKLGADARQVTIETFHSLCFSLICQFYLELGFLSQPVILDPESEKDIVARLSKEIGRAATADRRESTLRQMLRTEGVVRYADISRLAIPLAPSLNVTDLYVDEFQDTNAEQFNFYEGIPAIRRFYVGDPDQAIYGWNGADIRYIERLAEQSRVVHLNKCYRCREAIVDGAALIIQNTPNNLTSETIEPVHEGGKVRLLPYEELVGELKAVKPTEKVAVLARYRATLTAIADAAELTVIGRRQQLLQSPAAFQVLALAMLPETPSCRHIVSTVCQSEDPRLLDEVRRKMLVGTSTGLEILCELHPGLAEFYGDIKDLPMSERLLAVAGRLLGMGRIGEPLMKEISTTAARFVRNVRRRDQNVRSFAAFAASSQTQDEITNADAPGVYLLTMHAAKGMEFDRVYVMPFEPYANQKARQDEENRVAYVAATRAREELVVVADIASNSGGFQAMFGPAKTAPSSVQEATFLPDGERNDPEHGAACVKL